MSIPLRRRPRLRNKDEDEDEEPGVGSVNWELPRRLTFVGRHPTRDDLTSDRNAFRPPRGISKIIINKSEYKSFVLDLGKRHNSINWVGYRDPSTNNPSRVKYLFLHRQVSGFNERVSEFRSHPPSRPSFSTTIINNFPIYKLPRPTPTTPKVVGRRCIDKT